MSREQIDEAQDDIADPRGEELARIIAEMQKDYTLTTLSMKWFKNADGSSNDYTVAY